MIRFFTVLLKDLLYKYKLIVVNNPNKYAVN